MKAFKTYESCPLDQRPPSIPLGWIWSHLSISSDKQPEYEAAGFTVLSDENFVLYIAENQQAYDDWANSFDAIGKQEELRIYSFIQKEFIKFHPSKIDFRRHLLPNVYFQKNVTMSPNGRPQKAMYYYEGVLIAEIEFTFQVNAFNFMTRRIEKLSYYKGSGEKSEQWLIADDIYDSNNPYHLGEMMKERSGARALILEGIKAFLNGVLAAYYVPQGKTYPEILGIAGDFWGVYSNDIDSWINVGSPKFTNNITTDTVFTFLNVQISAGVTVRQYILDKVSY
jgi:hypothetical protein